MMRKLVIIIVGAWLAACIVPLLWMKGVGFDKTAFTAEWYKECAAVGKLLLAFVLGSIIAERYKLRVAQQQADARESEALEQWRDTCGSLRKAGEVLFGGAGVRDEHAFKAHRAGFEAAALAIMDPGQRAAGPPRSRVGSALRDFERQFEVDARGALGSLVSGLNDGSISCFSGCSATRVSEWKRVRKYVDMVAAAEGAG